MSKSIARSSLVKVTVLLASFIILLNLLLAVRMTSEIPIVDGWASLNRLMHFLQGEMRWRQYLFLPHGAHLHMPVYLFQWFDFRYFGGNQYLEQAISYLSIAIFALMTVYYVTARGIHFGVQRWAIIFAACASAALLTTLSDVETMLMPFQVVLTFARLSYMGLLALLVYAMANNKSLLYWITIVISAAAVTFHGAGYLFGGCVVLVHLIYWRGLVRCWPSLVPLAVLMIVKQAVPQGSGELGKIDLLFSPKGIVEFIPGIFAYFATPFIALRPYLGDGGLLGLGIAIGLGVTLMTLSAAWNVFNMRLWSRQGLGRVLAAGRQTSVDPHHAYILITGVMLLLSAAAVSVFWIVRLNGTTAIPYVAIMAVSRYMAYASLAVIMLFLGLFSFARRPQKSRLYASARLAIPMIILVFSSWTLLDSKRDATLADGLAVSAAGLSMGLSPLVPVVDAIWPEAITDWYWKTQLPQTVMFMRMKKKAYWDHLPPLNSTLRGEGAGVQLTAVNTKKVPGANLENRCEFEAKAPQSGHWLAAPAPMAVSNERNTVIGYGVRLLQGRGGDTAVVKGYLLCDHAGEMLTLNSDVRKQKFVVSGDDFSTRKMQISDVTDATWRHGVAVDWSGLVAHETLPGASDFQVGQILIFESEKMRNVIRIEHAHGYVNVFLDGTKLDGDRDGYPHKILAIKQ